MIHAVDCLLLVFGVQAAVLLGTIIVFVVWAGLPGDNWKSVLQRTPELRPLPPECLNESLVVIEAVLLGPGSHLFLDVTDFLREVLALPGRHRVEGLLLFLLESDILLPRGPVHHRLLYLVEP